MIDDKVVSITLRRAQQIAAEKKEVTPPLRMAKELTDLLGRQQRKADKQTTTAYQLAVDQLAALDLARRALHETVRGSLGDQVLDDALRDARKLSLLHGMKWPEHTPSILSELDDE